MVSDPDDQGELICINVGRFELVLMTTHNLELTFMGDIKQRDVSLIDKLVGA
jgi:hypothetical protein